MDHQGLAGVAGDPSKADAPAWESYLVDAGFEDDRQSDVAVGWNLGNIRDAPPNKVQSILTGACGP
jgi:hypothetical protein